MNQEIYLVGLNHKTAGVDIRERFALSDCDPVATGLVSDGGAVSEVMILSTCNRVEFLVVGSRDAGIRAKILRFWADQCGQPVADLENHTYCHAGDEAVNHLFTVASSSIVVPLSSIHVGVRYLAHKHPPFIILHYNMAAYKGSKLLLVELSEL